MLHKPNPHSLARIVPLFVCLLLAGLPALNLQAQPTNRSQLFYDDFEIAAQVSPYTIAQQQANNSLATDSDPGPAQLGSWFTYGGEADGGPGLFGVQVTTNVDAAFTGNYQSNNVLRVFRSPVGSGSATCANFAKAQIGGMVRLTW